MSAISNYSYTVQKIKAMQEEAKAMAKSAFHEGAAEIFKNFPKLDSFAWKQYTPYFNDGDACTFSANTSGIDLGYDGMTEEDYGFYRCEEDENKDRGACAAQIDEFLSAFAEDDLRSLFDDHVCVTVTKAGTTTEEYSHD